VIVSLIKRRLLVEYNLGKYNPPSNIDLPKSVELIWNEDDTRWEVYKIQTSGAVASDDLLCWQISAPSLGLEVTPGIKDWLQKYDTSKGGAVSTKRRQTDWLRMFQASQYRLDQRREAEHKELIYELSHRAKFLSQLISRGGKARNSVVVPAMVVGRTAKGVPIRAYKKVK